MKRQFHILNNLLVHHSIFWNATEYTDYASNLFLQRTLKKMQQCIKILLFLVLNEAQHVSGDTPPIIRSLKLQKQPLDLHTWKVVGRAVVGRCQVAYESVYCTLSYAI